MRNHWPDRHVEKVPNGSDRLAAVIGRNLLRIDSTFMRSLFQVEKEDMNVSMLVELSLRSSSNFA